jgi:hypothetical protein
MAIGDPHVVRSVIEREDSTPKAFTIYASDGLELLPPQTISQVVVNAQKAYPKSNEQQAQFIIEVLYKLSRGIPVAGNYDIGDYTMDMMKKDDDCSIVVEWNQPLNLKPLDLNI